MDYPKFPVTIHYISKYPSGQQLINTNGVTSSIPTYAGGYYVAQMHVTEFTATGSTYESSLASVLAIATASNNSYNY